MKKKVLIIVLVVIGIIFLLRACGSSPTDISKNEVKGFMESLKDGKIVNAVKLLDPNYREYLEKSIGSVPTPFAEYKNYELLGSVLSAEVKELKSWKVVSAEKINDNQTKVVIRTKDKEGMTKDVIFYLAKENDHWKIVSIQ